MFLALLFLFIRFLPMISAFEMRERGLDRVQQMGIDEAYAEALQLVSQEAAMLLVDEQTGLLSATPEELADAIVAAGDARISLARAITTSGHCPDYTSNAHAGR